MEVSGISHETEEQLELYALRRLPEVRVAAVEEHLLVCASCQESLDELDAFALAMRQAIAGEPATATRTDWFAWLRQPAVAWVGGFAALVLAAGFYWNSGRGAIAPLASLQLTAMRGEIPLAALARETDLTLTDAPTNGVLRVEVVDSTGGTIWSSSVLATGDAGRVKIVKQLAQGDYLVRLYDGTGKLLHEYGFRVRAIL